MENNKKGLSIVTKFLIGFGCIIGIFVISAIILGDDLAYILGQIVGSIVAFVYELFNR